MLQNKFFLGFCVGLLFLGLMSFSKSTKKGGFGSCSIDDAPDSIKLKWAYSEKQLAIDGDLSQADRAIISYMVKYDALARKEARVHGVPFEIILAQAILESGKGTSKLARLHNNHFGIKCFSRKCKKGHCANFTDDSHKDFFRVYPNAAESFSHHSKFLKGKNYKQCRACGKKNYRCWAKELQKAGYATSPTYEAKLIKLIENYIEL